MLDLALIMDACLNPFCNPAIVISSTATEGKQESTPVQCQVRQFRKYLFLFGIPVLLMILLYYMNSRCQAILPVTVAAQ